MNRHTIYIIFIGVLYAAFTVVFCTWPRSTYSELEKRELAKLPEFTIERFTSGEYTGDVSNWFSDSEPFRDIFMAVSMNCKKLIAADFKGEETITFHAGETTLADELNEDTTTVEHLEDISPTDTDQTEIDPYKNHVTADENAKIAHAGIIIVGSGENVRALMAFGGGSKGGVAYAEIANKFKEAMPDVSVYCMVIPTAVEFYCPDVARKRTRSQRAVINNVHSRLAPGVKAVDIYTPLSQHVEEDIYLRTDHHWSPLGAFYAAEKLAQVADVPFRQLDSYRRRVVHGYVGSMYGYSQDISVKNAPEDFVYYTPKDVEYTTTYINYTINKNYQVTGMGRPFKSQFFFHYRDGNGGAYCTFMGGDTKITQVRTSTANGRRIMIIKDSFGNAIPGYLFYSFEEVHVIDSRYFTKNVIEYVRENKITDLVFANNIFNAYNPAYCRKYLRFLTQTGVICTHPDNSEKTDVTTESNASDSTQTVKKDSISM